MSLSSYNLEEICFLANVAMVLSVNPVQLMIYVHMYPNNFITSKKRNDDEECIHYSYSRGLA